MRIDCPLCGPRDRREFYYAGADLPRPAEPAWGPEWDDYLHLRDNPAGRLRELWHHSAGCAQWLSVERDTRDHAVFSVRLASEARA